MMCLWAKKSLFQDEMIGVEISRGFDENHYMMGIGNMIGHWSSLVTSDD